MFAPRRRFLALTATLLIAAISAVAGADSPDLPTPEAPPSLFLVADRQLTHPSFRETVVLVTRHGRGGPIGVIVNRPLDVSLDKIFPTLDVKTRQVLHDGGPVERQLLSYIFRGGKPAAGTLAVAEKTYIARSSTLLAELLRGDRPHTGLRVVAGYAGWAPGQLENEINRGDWHVLPVDSTVLFDRPIGKMWSELHRRATQTTVRHEPPPAGEDRLAKDHPMLISTVETSPELPRP